MAMGQRSSTSELQHRKEYDGRCERQHAVEDMGCDRATRHHRDGERWAKRVIAQGRLLLRACAQ